MTWLELLKPLVEQLTRLLSACADEQQVNADVAKKRLTTDV